MWVYALTIFLGAFLLFQVQPLIGKYILPWFGGGPGVWTTCMLFFQVLLLGGYAYAHGLTQWLKPRRQVLVQGSLVGLALLLLPIIPKDSWKPGPETNPAWQILVLLTASLGAPYFVLSSTGPLLQRWFSLSFPGRSPYRLFALSNAGSFLALLSYPFFFETHFTRQTQARLWGWGLAFYAAAMLLCGWRLWRLKIIGDQDAGAGAPAGKDPVMQAASSDSNTGQQPRRVDIVFWLSLPACASALLLAVTNKLCLDVAVVPFLWVLPLAVYLLSFIVAFDSPRWYARLPFTGALIVAMASLVWALHHAPDWPVWKQVTIYSAGLFVCCLVCHGELYRLRPTPERLTRYYLLIAAGGALGGMFVGLLAPVVFDDYLELHWSLGACAALFVLGVSRGEPTGGGSTYWKWVSRLLPVVAVIGLDYWMTRLVGQGGLNRVCFGALRVGMWVALLLLVGWSLWRAGRVSQRGWRVLGLLWLWLGVVAVMSLLWMQARDPDPEIVHKSRNFYGVLTLYERSPEVPEGHHFLLQHGRITHGFQFTDPVQAEWATTYFGQETGVGIMLRTLQIENRRVGIVGLGTGTLAAYGKPGDYFRFYEINHAVELLARSPFRYLTNSPARVEIARGDARLSLEREPGQQFDALILDAFSSDSIPVHLLTREAFQTYGKHLKTNGVIAVHISNHYLDLEPVVLRLAKEFQYETALLDYEEREDAWWVYAATWVLLSRNHQIIDSDLVRLAATRPKPLPPRAPLWTDDFVSLFQILRPD